MSVHQCFFQQWGYNWTISQPRSWNVHRPSLELIKPNDPEVCTQKQLPANIAFPFSAIMRVCNFILVVFAFCSLPKETLRISRNPKARFSLLIKIPLRIEIFNTNICWISILFTTTFCYDPSSPNLQIDIYIYIYIYIHMTE